VLLQGFSRRILSAVWYVSQAASVMFQLASVTHAQLMSFVFGASQEV
jgi:hypothetical protein